MTELVKKQGEIFVNDHIVLYCPYRIHWKDGTTFTDSRKTWLHKHGVTELLLRDTWSEIIVLASLPEQTMGEVHMRRFHVTNDAWEMFQLFWERDKDGKAMGTKRGRFKVAIDKSQALEIVDDLFEEIIQKRVKLAN